MTDTEPGQPDWFGINLALVILAIGIGFSIAAIRDTAWFLIGAIPMTLFGFIGLGIELGRINKKDESS